MQLTLLPTETEADRKFKDFHEKNPQVYKALVSLALSAVAAGRKKLSIELLINRVRWDFMMQTTDEDYKINNNYKSRYARLIMAQEPKLEGLFNTRELHS